MKNTKILGVIISWMILSSFVVSTIQSWKISDNFSIQFSSSKASGSFEKFSGDIVFDEQDLSNSSFEVEIAVSSIKTGNFLKNSHAKGKKWFEAKKYPLITYTSNTIENTSSGYQVMGTLDMHGVQKELTIPFTFKNDVFQGEFIVNRTDFNIGSVKGLAKKVPEEISLKITVPVTK